ncbi:hypothetical protein [Tomitella fengzijianii]|uniref:Uncharacterized protein n=1 Tax=Tomitella fengzijianii TaxID=2597660 RepID=A0A516X4E8_9ACTN|nr:hypothetical protein [Tomitella fengzijianii]QDQ97948.1 hypothetical protein FO059_12290 [Tomitella fengzijianii]
MGNQQWVDEVTGGASLRAIGDRIGKNHVTVGRRIADGQPDICIAIARAYDADPIAGLVVWGVLSDGEVRAHVGTVALSDATDLELAEELVRRIKTGEHEGLTAPIDNIVDIGERAPRDHSLVESDDLAVAFNGEVDETTEDDFTP